MNVETWRRSGMVLVGALALTWGAGCGESTPTVANSDAKATLSGTITVDGKPLSRGEISFDPSNVSRKMAPMVVAKIETGGKYKIETLVGENAIRVTSPDLKRGIGAQVDIKEGQTEHNLDLHTAK